jgi:hypothetical protein
MEKKFFLYNKSKGQGSKMALPNQNIFNIFLIQFKSLTKSIYFVLFFAFWVRFSWLGGSSGLWVVITTFPKYIHINIE